MKFTKVLSIVLAVLMVVCCFAACSEEETKGESTPGAVETTPETNKTTPDAQEPADAEIPEDETTKETLKMATNAQFKPYEFYDGEKIVGIDAEIAQAIADKLGMELVIEDMAFDSIITAVDQGSVDFGMAGMTVTDERKENVDFSLSYASGVQSIIVKEGSPITSYDSLASEGATYKVGVQLGTTGDIYASDEFGDRVSQYANGNEAVLALLGGSVDCVIIDNAPATALVEANEGLVILETAYANEDYAICVKKGNTELLDKLNAAILDLIEDGTVDAIIAKYIK